MKRIRAAGRIASAFVLPALCAIFASTASAADPELIARQVIIRAPEAKVIDIVLLNTEDKPLADQLRAWVKDGTAKIVSDVSSLVNTTGALVIRSGGEVRHITENDQEFDTGELRPIAWEQVFVGTSAVIQVGTPWGYTRHPHVDAFWSADFSPCDHARVDWPCWWPTVKKPTVHWYEQQDFFNESVNTSVSFIPGHDTILGMMRPADPPPRLEEGEPPPAPTLDVVLAQLNPTGDAVPPVEKAPGTERFMVLGYGMSDRVAADVLSRKITVSDAGLLDQVRRMEAAGTAKLRTVSGLRTRSGQRATISTVRQHMYPTEMPTIPSAWSMRPVGTRVEADIVGGDVNLSFEHHPSPPQRLDWKCATDSDELVMWQPGFYVQSLVTAVTFNDEGAALLGAMRTPDCIGGGEGPAAGETVVFIATLQGAPAHVERPPGRAPADPFAAATTPGPGTVRAGTVRGAELEAVVFDVPASEAPRWDNPSPIFDDGMRFAELMTRVDGKAVKLAAHVVVSTRSGQRATVSDVQERPIVTEVDPPEDGFPGRYRPTAMERIHCGTTFQVDPVIEPDVKNTRVRYVLKHHVAIPKEPDLRDVLAELLRTKGDEFPQATLFEEEWVGDATLDDDGTRFIGARVPPGDALKDRLHVAFLRMRLSR